MARTLGSLPVGAKVVDKGTKYYGAPIVWLVGGHNHYGQGNTIMVSRNIISLKAIDAKEPRNPISNRATWGNNHYRHSNIRQWLNSRGRTWYRSAHTYDESPTSANMWGNYNAYSSESGFLTNFSPEMIEAIPTVAIDVVRNTSDDGGGYDILYDQVFLLSNTELGFNNENGIAEGSFIPLFSDSTLRVTSPTAQAVANSEYKSSKLAESKPYEYWLRTPSASNTHLTIRVLTDNKVANRESYDGSYGIRPALNLKSTTLVKDFPNSYGEYEIVWTYLYPMSGTDLGSVTEGASILKYTPKRYPTGTIATEKLNGVLLGTKTISPDVEYTVSVSPAQWDGVKYGGYKDSLGNRNRITIEMSNGDIHTYPFTKVLPSTAKSDDVLVASNDMANTTLPSNKRVLRNAIGSKATVGGAGSFEDIARAVSNISASSFKKTASTTATVSSDRMTFETEQLGTYTSLPYVTINTSYLGFTPDIIDIYTRKSNFTYITRWRREGAEPERANAVMVGNINGFYLPYKEGTMYFPVHYDITGVSVTIKIEGSTQ